MEKNEWKRAFKQEFGIHFKDSSDELKFALEFIGDLLEEQKQEMVKKTKKINKSIPKEFFEDEKLEIGRILIEELTNWKDVKSPSSEEFYRLVNRLFNIIKQKFNKRVIKKCEVSPLYTKDNDDTLHFYCDYCGEEMAYDEVRECKAEREKCLRCGKELGDSDYSVGVCLNCEYKLINKKNITRSSFDY